MPRSSIHLGSPVFILPIETVQWRFKLSLNDAEPSDAELCDVLPDRRLELNLFLFWIFFQETPSIVSRELNMAERELEAARLAGRELRFPKEKREILMLACSQVAHGDGLSS